MVVPGFYDDQLRLGYVSSPLRQEGKMRMVRNNLLKKSVFGTSNKPKFDKDVVRVMRNLGYRLVLLPDRLTAMLVFSLCLLPLSYPMRCKLEGHCGHVVCPLLLLRPVCIDNPALVLLTRPRAPNEWESNTRPISIGKAYSP